MAAIGITGGVASGKTTFRDLLVERTQADYFDSDRYANELLAELSVQDEIRRTIHPDAVTAEGALDRAFLRDLVFQEPKHKATLESILHPRIRQAWTSAVAQAHQEGRLFFVDIPLLFETKAESYFDSIVVVACSEATQIARIVGNRGLSTEIAAKIIQSQMPTSDKVARSHHVIWNDGRSSALTTQADLFSSYLHARYG